MTQAKYEKSIVLWKGSNLAVVQMKDGKKIKLAISYYGGFFKVVGDDGYYLLDGEARDECDDAISRINQSNFVPKRIERHEGGKP